MSNGFRYAVFDSIPNYGWPLDFRYLRQSGDTVYHYDATSQSEELLYRFDASPGDTLLIIPSGVDTFSMVFQFQRTITLFGAQRRQWVFGIFPYHILDVGHSRTITDSLGLTNLGEANGTSNLQGAVINGVTYGNITSIVPTILPPEGIALHQNFPNPFNPSTTITYQIPEGGHVNLTVYDMLGQTVRELVNEYQFPGPHSAVWDGRNAYGNKVVSGTYLCRLEAGQSVKTNKMILLK